MGIPLRHAEGTVRPFVGGTTPRPARIEPSASFTTARKAPALGPPSCFLAGQGTRVGANSAGVCAKRPCRAERALIEASRFAGAPLRRRRCAPLPPRMPWASSPALAKAGSSSSGPRCRDEKFHSEHHVEILIPLKKNMDLYADALGLAQSPQAHWHDLPTPAPMKTPAPTDCPEPVVRRELKRRKTLQDRRPHRSAPCSGSTT